MTTEGIKKLIAEGEGVEVEFKASSQKLPKNVFESVCSFLNRRGGHLFLGVEDHGFVSGVPEDKTQQIKDSFVSNANNPQKLSPPVYLEPEVFELEGKYIIYVRIPESSQVHKTNAKIFDRNEDGDFDITHQSDNVRQLYLRKGNFFSENNIFPAVSLEDFRTDLFDRVRKLARNNRPDHPWLEMSNEELLRSTGLYRKDFYSGKEGYTLAAILLFGKDEVIQSVLPHYKTDALLRKVNVDRYDDRDEVRTNLIESYDRLMAFVEKHLPDNFVLEGDQRISARNKIFREVIVNTLIHREFLNPFPAKFIIGNERVYIENWNKPHGHGAIDPAFFSPYPKNPLIARIFKEIGRMDELGSGIRNTYKYIELYIPGAKPQFIEEDVFKTIIPLKPSVKTEEKTPVGKESEVIEGAINKAIALGVKTEKINLPSEKVRERYIQILKLLIIHQGLKAPELAELLKVGDRTIRRNLHELQELGLVSYEGARKTGLYRFKNQDFTKMA